MITNQEWTDEALGATAIEWRRKGLEGETIRTRDSR